MKNGHLLLLTACIFMAALSCKKKKTNPREISLTYTETQCSDPWYPEVPITGGNVEQRLEAWLETKAGAAITKTTRTFAAPVTDCKACPCINGYTLRIWTSRDAEKKFLDLGFTKVP